MELVLPRQCVGCGRDGIPWCRDCLEAELAPILHRPDPCPPGLPPLAAAARYSGSVRSAVLEAKERDRRELDRLLGAVLATAVGLLVTAEKPWLDCARPLWLVPVPASARARRDRGRDQVSDWTRWSIRWLQAAGVPARQVPALRRARSGLDSVGLDAGQRAANLSEAFALTRIAAAPVGTTLVIVDDVVTTGATLVAATACLSTGLRPASVRVRAAVVAATARRSRPPTDPVQSATPGKDGSVSGPMPKLALAFE